jgi:hypothetical protein
LENIIEYFKDHNSLVYREEISIEIFNLLLIILSLGLSTSKTVKVKADIGALLKSLGGKSLNI